VHARDLEKEREVRWLGLIVRGTAEKIDAKMV
jgi:hypothetical protein